MARLSLLLFFVGLVLAVIALISCLSAKDGEVRALPRWAWIVIILLFPLIGSVVYFFAGRPDPSQARKGSWRPGSGSPEAERPKRPIAADDDPEFLRKLGEKGRQQDEDLLRRWEEDLRKREKDMRKQDDTPPTDG